MAETSRALGSSVDSHANNKKAPVVEVIDVKCNYFVLHTGYTQRLVDNEELKEWLATVNEDEDVDENTVELLFINDKVWGEGLTKIGKDVGEVDRLIEILKAAGKFKSGIACFRGYTEDCYSLGHEISLGDIQYCRIFNLVDTTLIKCGKDSIIIHYYDSESG